MTSEQKRDELRRLTKQRQADPAEKGIFVYQTFTPAFTN